MSNPVSPEPPPIFVFDDKLLASLGLESEPSRQGDTSASSSKVNYPFGFRTILSGTLRPLTWLNLQLAGETGCGTSNRLQTDISYLNTGPSGRLTGPRTTWDSGSCVLDVKRLSLGFEGKGLFAHVGRFHADDSAARQFPALGFLLGVHDGSRGEIARPLSWSAQAGWRGPLGDLDEFRIVGSVMSGGDWTFAGPVHFNLQAGLRFNHGKADKTEFQFLYGTQGSGFIQNNLACEPGSDQCLEVVPVHSGSLLWQTSLDSHRWRFFGILSGKGSSLPQDRPDLKQDRQAISYALGLAYTGEAFEFRAAWGQDFRQTPGQSIEDGALQVTAGWRRELKPDNQKLEMALGGGLMVFSGKSDVTDFQTQTGAGPVVYFRLIHSIKVPRRP